MKANRDARKTVQTVLIVCLFFLTLALNVSRAVRADYSHDEDQFIASARLFLDEGALPYRDYPLFSHPLPDLYLCPAVCPGWQLQFACRALVFGAVCQRERDAGVLDGSPLF